VTSTSFITRCASGSIICAVHLSEAEISMVLANRLVIAESIKWSRKESRDWVEANLRVHHESEGELTMRITASLVLPKSSFTLLYRKQVVKRLDINGNHANKCRDRRVFDYETHKHVFTDDCGTSWAYMPEDITSEEPHICFAEFCQECGI